MRLINWNISAFNWNIEKAINRILSHDPDILCIQELPQRGIEYLKEFSNYHVAYCVDTEARVKSKNVFLAILTKYEPVTTGNYDYGQDEVSPPLVWFVERLLGREKQYKSLYVDVKINGETKRVHNIHLTWAAGPEIRSKEFSRFLEAAKPKKSDLVFGDLNTFGKTTNNILVYMLFGYRFKDLFTNEKNIFKNFFKRYEWQNPFEGTISPTWPWRFSGAQLDYILISKDLVIENKHLLEESYGSDHRPQILEISGI